MERKVSLYKILKNSPESEEKVKPYNMYEKFGLEGLVFEEIQFQSTQNEVSTEELTPIESVEDEADAMIQEARAEAIRIIESAKIEAKQVEKTAFEEGFQLGQEEGHTEGKRQAKEEVELEYRESLLRFKEDVIRKAKEVQEEKEKVLEQYMDDLKNISLAIGEKIVQTSLKSSKDVVERMIIASTEKLKKVSWAKVYIANTGEATEIQGDSEFLKNLSKLADNVKIIIMDDEDPGTCIVETPNEILDISVKTQLENIKEILNNARI